MRVLILGDPRFVPVRNLIEYLRSIEIDVQFATFVSGADSPAVPSHPIPHRGRVGLVFARRAVAGLAETVGADVVHAFYVTSYGYLASSVRSAPVLVSAMGTDVFGAPELSRWLAPLRRRLNVIALRRADHVHSVAPHLTARLVEWGIPESKIATFPRGVALDRFTQARRPNPPVPPWSMLCNRKLEPVYDHDTLVRGWTIAADSGLPLRLRLAGDGYLRPAIETLIVQSGLRDRVEWIGQVPHTAMPGILHESDLFASASRSDGTSSCLLEALAAGAIPVVTDIPANRAWLRDGETGFLFEPGNPVSLAEALSRAAAASDRWDSIREENRRRVESGGSLEAGHRRTVGIYESIVADVRG